MNLLLYENPSHCPRFCLHGGPGRTPSGTSPTTRSLGWGSPNGHRTSLFGSFLILPIPLFLPCFLASLGAWHLVSHTAVLSKPGQADRWHSSQAPHESTVPRAPQVPSPCFARPHSLCAKGGSVQVEKGVCLTTVFYLLCDLVQVA